MGARPFRDRREGSLIDANQSPEPRNAMQAGHGPRHVPRAIVETATDPAGELGHIQVPAAATTAWTQEPRHCPVGPHGRNPNPVDQKIGALSGELVPPTLAPIATPSITSPPGVDLDRSRQLVPATEAARGRPSPPSVGMLAFGWTRAAIKIG